MSLITIYATVNLLLACLLQDTPPIVVDGVAAKPEIQAHELVVEVAGEQLQIVRGRLWTDSYHQLDRVVVGLQAIEQAIEVAGKPQFGVHIRRADDTLRKHLKLKSGVGLVVESVVPNSGAAAAGVQVDDILVKLDDQWLINAEQFTTLVRNSELGRTVKTTLIREGLTQELMIGLQETVVAFPARNGLSSDMEAFFVDPPGDEFHKNLPAAHIANCSACHRSGVPNSFSGVYELRPQVDGHLLRLMLAPASADQNEADTNQ